MATVADKINNMIYFIDAETAKKVEEIEAKTKEMATITHDQIINTETLKTRAGTQAKVVTTNQNKQIAISQLITKARLDVQKVQLDNLERLVATTRQRLVEFVTKEPARYYSYIVRLIKQTVSELHMDVAIIRFMPADKPLFNKIATELRGCPETAKCELRLSDDDLEAETVIGGVMLSNADKKLNIDCTFAKRLVQASELVQPEVMSTMFPAVSDLWQ